MDEKILRLHLVNLLNGNEAHITFDKVTKDYPFDIVCMEAPGMPYTAWQIMEHMRIAQWDILNFSISSEHVSPDFPDGYWPEKATPNQEQDWIDSVDIFKAELEEMKNLARNPEVDLFAPIPHGTGQTILREINVVADHNSYHLGQLMLIKKMFQVSPSH